MKNLDAFILGFFVCYFVIATFNIFAVVVLWKITKSRPHPEPVKE